VDTLALGLSPLIPLLADPAASAILHAAEYDVLCMKRDSVQLRPDLRQRMRPPRPWASRRSACTNLLAEQLG